MVLIGCAFDNQVLLTIDDEKYTVADFKERMPLSQADDSVRRREKVNDFVNQMLMVREARERGYADDPVIQTNFEAQRKDILSRAYYEEKVMKKAKIPDSEVREIYDKIVDKYHLAQIVVENDSLAQYIEGELRRGVLFDSLLHFSLDTLTEDGDIGEFSSMQIPPEILKPLSKLREGDVTDAIQLGEFFYFLKVIEHEKSETPKYEEIKENIRNNLLRDKAGEIGEKLVDKLIADAKIEYNQEGLDALIKPDSLLTEEDLNKWVVKKYDTAYVYVRTLRDAVYQQYKRSSIDPQILIERVLVPDLIYDRVIKERYDKRPDTKRQLRTILGALMQQKLYAEEVIDKATVDSTEVEEYYEAHRDEYKDKQLKDVYLTVKTTIRDAKIDTLRQNLFNNLREKYKPDVSEAVMARLLREEK